ncbi:hypothetical protein EDD86DRAFT_206957, partial [Gorgonomyces haynaldii]
MSARFLINHVKNLLKIQEDTRLGRSGALVEKSKPSFEEPITKREEDVLEQYLLENNIKNPNERLFITETFFGCYRQRRMIEETLSIFFKETDQRYLQKDYHLYSIITYLALWRLDELGFDQFKRFISCFRSLMMVRFISFLFNPQTVQAKLKPKWLTLFDQEYVQTNFVDPITHHLHVVEPFLEELIEANEHGEKVLKPTKTKTTKMEPFLLTQPRPRRVQTVRMEEAFPKPKARPIPKNLFEKPKEMVALEIIKQGNKEKAKMGYQVSQMTAFKAAIIKPSSKTQNQSKTAGLEEEDRAKHPAIKIAKPVPKFNHVPVKLTTAAILREDILLKKKRQEEEKHVSEMEMGLRDAREFEQWQEEAKIREKEEYQLELERKRLQVQLAHEESMLARLDKLQENKEKAAVVLQEKEEIQQIVLNLKLEKEEENKKKVELVQEMKQSAIKAKEQLTEQKQKQAQLLHQESQQLLQQAHEKHLEEIKRKQELIQQIRLLEKSVPSVGTIQKEVDFTETSGIGLLGEMSMLELQERLIQAQRRHQQQQEDKRREIAQIKYQKEMEIQQKMQSIYEERQERKNVRMSKQIPDRSQSCMSSLSNSTSQSFKEQLIESNPLLRDLQQRIYQKKTARLVKTQSLSRPGSKIPPKNTTLHTFDELDDAERNYVARLTA